jgi:hypothetical protein
VENSGFPEILWRILVFLKYCCSPIGSMGYVVFLPTLPDMYTVLYP